MADEEVQEEVPDNSAARALLDSFDKDGSGYLEPGEAVAALTQMGNKVTFSDLDTDGDNRISFEEFEVHDARARRRNRCPSEHKIIPVLTALCCRLAMCAVGLRAPRDEAHARNLQEGVDNKQHGLQDRLRLPWLRAHEQGLHGHGVQGVAQADCDQSV